MTSHSVAAALKTTVPIKKLFSSDDNPQTYYDVTIQFHSAQNLPRTDVIGYSDPYFVAKIDNQITYTSTIIPCTSAPEWDEQIWFVRNVPRNAQLTVVLFDKDDEKLVDDFIGRFCIPNLIDYDPPEDGELIVGPFEKQHGYFHLTVHAELSNAESQELPPYTYDGPCRFSRHDSVAIGRLIKIHSHCAYSTWKIHMRRISAFFPPYERQHWNRAYSKAHAIFGHCPINLASQGTIRFGHKILYGQSLKHHYVGRLTSAADLWKMVLTDPTTGRIRPFVYTYVIDDYSWRFSETGHQFFKDFASKHALLANVSESVRYAGEFHARPKHGWDRCDDEWELVLDNNSGTYAPSHELLNNLQQLFLFNFPGLNVVVYDYKDPQLKASVQELKAAAKEYRHLTPTIDRLFSHTEICK